MQIKETNQKAGEKMDCFIQLMVFRFQAGNTSTRSPFFHYCVFLQTNELTTVAIKERVQANNLSFFITGLHRLLIFGETSFFFLASDSKPA